MTFNSRIAHQLLIAAAAAIAISSPASALTFQPSISKWTATHTEAPSHFSPLLSESRITSPAHVPGFVTFSAPATGPAGAQFGHLPYNNNSFVDPTRNSVNAHQTQNSVQATNTMEATQAVQGRNCSLNAIRAGLCQGR